MEPPKVFTARFDEKVNKWYLDINKDLTKDQRKQFSLRVANAVLERRLLSSAELDACGTFEPLPNTVYWFPFERGDVPAFLHVTEDWLHEHGYLDRLLAIREFLLQREVRERFEEIYTEQEGTSKLETGRRGTVYEYGVTFQPGYGAGRAQLSALARAAEEISGTDLMTAMVDLCNEVSDEWFGDIEKRGLEEFIIRNASVLPGSGNKLKQQTGLTSSQINYVKPSSGLESLMKFGGAHPDMHDHFAFRTVLLNLCHFGPNDFGGRFNILPWSAAIPMGSVSMLFFSARFYHCATGFGEYTVDKNSPFRFPPVSGLVPDLDPAEFPYMRLTIPIYPDKRMLEPNFRWFKQEVYNSKGLAFFPNKERHNIWMMSLYIVQEPGIRSLLASHDDDTDEVFGNGPDRLIEASGNAFKEVMNKRIDRRAAQKTKMKAAISEAAGDPSSASRVLPQSFLERPGSMEVLRSPQEALPDNRVELHYHDGDCSPAIKHATSKRKKSAKGQNHAEAHTNEEGGTDGEARAKRQLADDESEEINGIKRNGSPEFYAMLFAYDGITPEIISNLIERAAATLASLRSTNTRYEALMKDLRTLDCGTKIKPGMVKYIESDTLADWQAPDLHIPGNPSYDCLGANKALEIEATAATLKLAEEGVMAAVQNVNEAWDVFGNWKPHDFMDKIPLPALRKLCEAEGLSGYQKMKRGEVQELLARHFNADIEEHVAKLSEAWNVDEVDTLEDIFGEPMEIQ